VPHPFSVEAQAYELHDQKPSGYPIEWQDTLNHVCEPNDLDLLYALRPLNDHGPTHICITQWNENSVPSMNA
jgi:hypothetical protein